MYYDKLDELKRPLIKSRRTLVIMIAAELLCAFVFLVMSVAFGAWSGLWAVVLFGGLSALFLPPLMNCNSLLRQFERIKINKTYAVRLYRPKFIYLTRSRGKYSCHYYGIKFYGADKRKYYYFFDEELTEIHGDLHRTVQEVLWRELYVQCYEGTSIVKTINNDPCFFRVRYGQLNIAGKKSSR
ncbi:MAG: hypothetical protein IJY08_02355 [Clostridia bacterium]|nr:hypothetical protein [Clostridia bacterium]